MNAPLANPLPAGLPVQAGATSAPVPARTANSKLTSKARSYIFANKPAAGGPQGIQKMATQGQRLRKPVVQAPGVRL